MNYNGDLALSKLTERDINILTDIYKFRGLTGSQIAEKHFLTDDGYVSYEYCRKRLSKLANKENLLYYKKYDKHSVYFLSPRGVSAVKTYLGLSTAISTITKTGYKRQYHTSQELIFSNRICNHQIELNQFVLDYEKLNIPLNCDYIDEKYIGEMFYGLRPDGILKIEDTYYFLEMDMATENHVVLREKWQKYRNFVSSKSAFDSVNGSIKVMFIVAGVKNPKNRIGFLKKTIAENIIDMVGVSFDVYVDTADNILDYIKQQVCTKYLGFKNDIVSEVIHTNNFKIASAESLSSYVKNKKFTYYIRKLNSDKKIVVENGKRQEFLLDDYSQKPISILNKIYCYEQISNIFKQNGGREIVYIVIVPSPEEIYEDLKFFDILNTKNVLFTTFDRLKIMPIHSALFYFDKIGNMYHFKDSGLSSTEFENKFE